MRIKVWCYDCDIELDSGIVDNESSLLVFNDFTKILEHQKHVVGIRQAENCSIREQCNKCEKFQVLCDGSEICVICKYQKGFKKKVTIIDTPHTLIQTRSNK